ncbi:MAG: 3,4-dihydroxy-2-butanone 4-phosphate synthase, partial [Klenkia sp.]|nr:3,4-dihydroxy-2-butanone 4-phosphate synthase [Klenkia sp.]
FVIRHTSGFVCVALEDDDCDRLLLPAMPGGDGGTGSPYRVTVDLRGEGTGISAEDRARTVDALSSATSVPERFTRPGHVVPLRAAAGGVLTSAGPAEAAVDLAGLAGRRRAAVLCAIVSPVDPTRMASGDELTSFARDHGLVHLGVADLVAHQERTQPAVLRDQDVALDTSAGVFRTLTYRSPASPGEHVAFVLDDTGQLGSARPTDVHVLTACPVHDLNGQLACAHARALDDALTAVRRQGSGVVVCVRPAGVLAAWRLGPAGHRAPAAEDVVAAVVADLQVQSAHRVEHGAGPSAGLPCAAPAVLTSHHPARIAG